MRKSMGTQCTVFSTLAKMPLHRDRSFRSSESVEEVQPFCLGRKFRGPEGPGMAGRSGDDRKVRWPEGPGKAGSSGGRESAKNRDFEIADLGGKTWGKTQIRGEKQEIRRKEGQGS